MFSGMREELSSKALVCQVRVPRVGTEIEPTNSPAKEIGAVGLPRLRLE